MKSSDCLIVLTTVPDERTARTIGRALVRQRLAACVTVTSQARSIYWWEGRVAEETERILFIKTRTIHFPRLEKELKLLHPYQVPEMIALPIIRGNKAYLTWLRKETKA